MRLLGAARLSHDTDASTSIERQREQIERYASQHGHTVVAITEDVDVSGAMDPFKRPQLGRYLNGRKGEWDVLVAAKLDRISRSVADFAHLVKWCRANGKTLVIMDPAIDLTTPGGQVMANVLMSFAEYEREMTRTRVTEARAKTRSVGRWTGGAVPYGYEPSAGPDGHQYLVPKPSEQAVVERIAQAVIEGTSVTQIVKQLNAEGIPSQKGGKWLVSTVLRLLRNDTIRGYVMHDGQVVRDLDGMPVTREPLVDDLTWAKLQSALARNATGRGANQRQKSPLLVGVAKCAGCGENMYARRMPGRDTHYYLCRTARQGGTCSSASIRMDDLEKAFRETLDSFMGGDRRHIRVEIPAEDHTWELATVQEQIEQIEAAVLAGLPVSSATRMLAKLEEKRETLAALPSRPAGWDIQLTDETWAQYWATLDEDGMRAWLLSEGLTVTVRGYPRGAAQRFELSQIRPVAHPATTR